MARVIIHELTHKILITKDIINDEKKIYGAEDCRKLTSNDPDLAVTIADNWSYFYMSFGCYPDQQEYAYQAEYEITASDKGRVPSRVCNIIKRPNEIIHELSPAQYHQCDRFYITHLYKS
jgi:hypothetical protein